MTREDFDKKYFTAKSQKDKNEAYIEYVFSLEAQLKAKQRTHSNFKELVWDCKQQKEIK